MGPLRLALVNDYEIVVQGFASMIRSYSDRIEIIEVDSSGAVSHPVDVDLYDTFAGDPAGHHLLRRMSTNPLIGCVVVYSWKLAPALVQAAKTNGARGYISKALPASELIRALEALARGEPEPPQNGRWHVEPIGGDWPGREEGLTQREAEVLALITQGLSNDAIAQRTRLSINSIKSYIRSAYCRIGVSDRPNAILWGIDHGLRPQRRESEPDGRSATTPDPATSLRTSRCRQPTPTRGLRTRPTPLTEEPTNCARTSDRAHVAHVAHVTHVSTVYFTGNTPIGHLTPRARMWRARLSPPPGRRPLPHILSCSRGTPMNSRGPTLGLWVNSLLWVNSPPPGERVWQRPRAR